VRGVPGNWHPYRDPPHEKGNKMVPWNEFVAAAPELAATGEDLLFQFGVGLAFLATVRRGGGPRLHPVWCCRMAICMCW